jgi:hypothetical protein
MYKMLQNDISLKGMNKKRLLISGDCRHSLKVWKSYSVDKRWLPLHLLNFHAEGHLPIF